MPRDYFHTRGICFDASILHFFITFLEVLLIYAFFIFSSLAFQRKSKHQEELYRATKSWTFTRSDYPSDALPAFPQGNAVILSRDLAAEVASLSAQPWLRLTMADDVLFALLLAKYHPFKVRAFLVSHVGVFGPTSPAILQNSLE
jgi:hypothetical protein